MKLGIIFGILFVTPWINGTTRNLPEKFMIGVGTSALQTEGAWNAEGKGESIWDYFVHKNRSIIADQTTADEASDAYHKWEDDIENINSMSHYSFSISWPRLLPNGFKNTFNMKAVSHYQGIIAELKKNNIQTVVTLYHWDLPMTLHNLGGWTNPNIIKWFSDYARLAFQSFPDVDYWITIYDPAAVCLDGYGTGKLAPFINRTGELDYLCSYNILKAHAAVYKIYKNEFKNLKGKLSMAVEFPWGSPFSYQKQDREAAERFNQFLFGLYVNPILKGNWPQVVIDRVNERCKKEMRVPCRLPQLTANDIDTIKHTADFIAVNYHLTNLVAYTEEDPDYDTFSFEKDLGIKLVKDPSWEYGDLGLQITPWGLTQALQWIQKQYGDGIEILITGNDFGNQLDVNSITQKREFLRNHLLAILDAIDGGISVIGYTYSSLLDGFEWVNGYKTHSGLITVDFQSPNKTRTPNMAYFELKSIAVTRSIYIPD